MESKSALLHVICVCGLIGIQSAATSMSGRTQGGQPAAHSPVVLKQQPARSGESTRYHVEIKISAAPAAPGQIITIREDLERRTQDVKPDGSFTLVDTFTAGTVSFGAAPQDILKMLPVVKIARDKDGKYTSTATGGSAEGNPEVLGVLQQFAAAVENLLPAGPVSVGGKWKVAFANANTMVGGAKVAGEAAFAGDERIDGVKTAKITFGLFDDGHEEDKQGQGAGVLNVDGHGRIVRLRQKGRGTFAGGPATVEIEITRAAAKGAAKRQAGSP